MNLKLELKIFNEFYRDLSSKIDIKEVEVFLLKSTQLVKARFGAVYELRGETYILVESDAVDKKNIAVPLRIGKKDLPRFKKSGNFSIIYFFSNNEKYMILFFTVNDIMTERYDGFFSIMLGYYEKVSNGLKSKGSEALL
ncbi:MAG: hypothetical protein L3J44_03380, partial [Campylobacteraceae bacterium]|nr:hypothetical protein [Campylobacteraceae bacterium]